MPTTFRRRSAVRAEQIAAPPFVARRESLKLPGATVENLSGGFALLLPAAAAPSSDTSSPDPDPRYRLRVFTRTAYLYAPQGTGFYRAIAFHFAAEQQIITLRTARLAARLLRLHRAHFNRDALFGRDELTADVWMVPGPSPQGSAVGGETHGSQVYLWATGTATRSPLEWTRTLVHEWGHLTLAAARGFSEPENDAAGFLGERLYLKWLREDKTSSAGKTDDHTRPADLDLYDKRQVAPLIARWLSPSAGPTSRLLDGRDTLAMDYYIGAVLAADNAFGSAVLGRALETVLEARPRAFLQSLIRVTAENPSFVAHPPAWVPLQKGRYLLSAPASGSVLLGTQTVNLSTSRPVPIRVAATGWQYLRPVRGGLTSVTLRRVGPPLPQGDL